MKDLNKMVEQVLAALSTYGRAFVSAVLALYMTGNTNPGDLVKGGIAAIVPVILKALNTNEPAFGFKKK
ncbi:hypothetical protein EB001_20600 [bacterium]|jgi:hypothetical protein|nr:hypothetical protein [bacterium]